MVRHAPVILAAVLVLGPHAGCGRSGEFRHAAHITVTKGECAACHGPDAAAPRPARDADCAACHRQAQEASPQGGGPYRVRKDRMNPGTAGGGRNAAFPHAPHAAAGMSCAECHDASKWRGNRFVRPTSDECDACHSGAPRKAASPSAGGSVDVAAMCPGGQENIDFCIGNG